MTYLKAFFAVVLAIIVAGIGYGIVALFSVIGAIAGTLLTVIGVVTWIAVGIYAAIHKDEKT